MHQRSFTVDVLKVVAAQLIVWHHFSAYGPMAQAMSQPWPGLMDWLYDNARMAVQVFLVMGGYLAAPSLTGQAMDRPLSLILKRYLRLVPIYMVALGIICVVVAVLRPLVQDDWLPQPPTAWQVVAHAWLLHDLLAIDALSSGVWYVAIDFQLFVIFVLLCCVVRGMTSRAASLGVALLCAASMLWFNRMDSLDMWAIYFFGAYGLGILAAWAKRSSFDTALLGLTVLVALAALWLDYRARLNLALVTAVNLAVQDRLVTRHWHRMQHGIQHGMQRLSNSAYALFLTHFGVIVVCSALWNLGGFQTPVSAVVLTGLAWLCAVAFGLWVHEKIETPLHRMLSKRLRLSPRS